MTETMMQVNEFERLSTFLTLVPTRVQKGLFKIPLVWTCIDVSNEYIAIGTDSGYSYLYDRDTFKTTKLECPEKDQYVTTLKMISSVDYLVAVGTITGRIFVYQLPSIVPGRNKDMLVYSVTGHHNSRIKSLEWSKNALKLYSGDEDGVVACSELLYSENRIRTYFIMKETNQIVQLSYTHSCLAVSTTSRSIVCDVSSIPPDPNQIGTKDRKCLGNYGSTFLPGIHSQKEAILYASRPGFRLWKSNIEGKVLATYLFKDLLVKKSERIDLLPSTSCDSAGMHIDRKDDYSFGELFIFNETHLVTHDNYAVYIIDPGLGTFVGYHTGVGPIINVAINKDEIMILRRSSTVPVIRLTSNCTVGRPQYLMSQARKTEKKSLRPEEQTTPIRKNMMPSDDTSPIDVIGETANRMSGSIIGALKGVGEKIQQIQDGQKQPPWGLLALNDEVVDRSAVKQDIVQRARETSAFSVSSPEDGSVQRRIPFEEVKSERAEHVVVGNVGESVQHLQINSQVKDSLILVDKAERFQNLNPDLLKKGSSGADIVFAHKHKKKKNLKKKINRDRDTISIASDDSLEGNYLDASRRDSSGSRPTSPWLSPQPFSNPIPYDNQKQQIQVNNEEAASTTFLSLRNETCEMKSTSSNLLEYHSDESNRCEDSHVVDQLCNEYVATDDVTVELVIGSALEISGNGQEHTHTEDSYQTLNINANLSNDVHTQANTIACFDRVSSYGNENTCNDDSQIVLGNTGISAKDSVLSPASESSVEDFYSKYRTDMYSSPSDVSPSYNDDGPSLQDVLEASASVDTNKNKKEPTPLESAEVNKILLCTDSWIQFSAPCNIQSLCVTDRHIWCCDKNSKSDNMYYSSLLGKGLVWNKVPRRIADQISVSSSGWLIWCLYKGTIFAATNVTPRSPFGKEWIKIATSVRFICIDEHVAWYVKLNGEVVMQKKLSKDRPSYRPIKIQCPHQVRIQQVICKRNIVWALSEDRTIIIRAGITSEHEEGTDWKFLHGTGPGLLVSNIGISNDETAWVVDLVGRVWYTTGVTQNRPEGSGVWWQVSLTEKLMQEARANEFLKTVKITPEIVTRLISGEKGAGLLSVGSHGVWVCPGFKTTLYMCKGSMRGYRWELVLPSGMVPSTRWLHICSRSVHDRTGVIWTQQPSHSLFCFPGTWQGNRVTEVSPPSVERGFVHISSTRGALWGLHCDGTVFVRAGINNHINQGLQWEQLDLTQLGKTRFVNISCGSENVWGVDQRGRIHFRIGVSAPIPGHLNPAWVHVPGTSKDSGAKFVQICAGLNDWMVWAIDTKFNIYCRKGITDSMPIGTDWVLVPGNQVNHLSVGNSLVHALTPSGEILCRYGVCEDNLMGDYWKKVAGVMSTISSTCDDDLWGIDAEGQLFQRHVHHLDQDISRADLGDSMLCSASLDEGDWEIL